MKSPVLKNLTFLFTMSLSHPRGETTDRLVEVALSWSQKAPTDDQSVNLSFILDNVGRENGTGLR
jgi:hypothetical protein